MQHLIPVKQSAAIYSSTFVSILLRFIRYLEQYPPPLEFIKDGFKLFYDWPST
jgi:hypothetical protein